MYDLLTKEEKEKIDKINSKFHGAEYLSKDLKGILKEINKLIGVKDCFIILESNELNHKEFFGKSQALWVKYSDKMLNLIKKSRDTKQFVSVKNLNDDINYLFILPIKSANNGEVIGFLILLNKEINYNKDKRITQLLHLIISQIYSYTIKLKEREELFKLFGRYVDKRQIAKILENPDFLKKPEMIDSVVLFADIYGFTRLANELSIDEVFTFLNNVFYEFTKIINQNNGIVDKFVGDQIIGVFGLIDRDNRSMNAIKSAVKMNNILKENFKKYGIGVKIGIVKANMLYGHLGSSYKSDLTVIGPGVNLASRLCNYANKGSILVNESIYLKVKDKYKFELKGQKKFKGFKNKISVYKLVF